MARKGYLANTRKEKTSIGGIGDFGADYKPLEVPVDVAHQYSTKEAKDEGWMVSWKEDAPVAPTPAPAAMPAPKAAESPQAEVKK